MAALRERLIEPSELASVMGWPDDPERARRVAHGLVADGLVSVRSGRYALGAEPNGPAIS